MLTSGFQILFPLHFNCGTLGCLSPLGLSFLICKMGKKKLQYLPLWVAVRLEQNNAREVPNMMPGTQKLLQKC